MTSTFRDEFLESIQKHQLTVLQNSENVKIFRFADPNTISLSSTIIYAANTCTITGDMGSYVFGRLLDVYGFFARNQSVFCFSYIKEKVLAQDVNGELEYFDGDLAKRDIRHCIDKYQTECTDEDKLIELNGLVDSLKYVDFSCEFKADEWLANATESFEELFGELSYRNFKELSPNFIWCAQAIIYTTRLFEQEFKND
ncbi:hypothetical protein BKK49_11245 [Rodentibacter rarus]|uniref:Uncharacterized protein n=1 Tax=Rodentibacter rarus TaxID=1908260 RepID=A0A1V3INJ8_9PAST|nr:hypothetical protein [Rodentibacter rarus]OOF37681.1 hypothetical protein BKK49_11245 [Rodentibacter rarus]OOF43753.1 hypothetical protein BKK50_04055 [Rodentibacter rarus]